MKCERFACHRSTSQATATATSQKKKQVMRKMVISKEFSPGTSVNYPPTDKRPGTLVPGRQFSESADYFRLGSVSMVVVAGLR